MALELGRWASILLARTVPGPRFALPERPFCGLPRRACACDAHFVKLCQNPIKTESKRMSACLCETPQPTKKRRQRASRRMLRDSCVRFPCQRVSAAFRCVPGGSPDAVGAARAGPGAPTEPPGRVMACLQSVPRASRNGLRRLLLARLGAQRRFGAFLSPFWSDFGAHFGAMLAYFSYKTHCLTSNKIGPAGIRTRDLRQYTLASPLS